MGKNKKPVKSGFQRFLEDDCSREDRDLLKLQNSIREDTMSIIKVSHRNRDLGLDWESGATWHEKEKGQLLLRMCMIYTDKIREMVNHAIDKEEETNGEQS